MNDTSTAPASSASVARPEFGNSTYSTGRLIACPSAAAMSAVTPCGLPSPSLTTKKIDFSGANTSATRSLPVGASSFTSSSRAAALSTSGRVNTTAMRIFKASLLAAAPSSHPALVDRRPGVGLEPLAQIGDQPLVGHELAIVVGDLIRAERLEAFRRRHVDARRERSEAAL